jgi:hypothetical protein
MGREQRSCDEKSRKHHQWSAMHQNKAQFIFNVYNMFIGAVKWGRTELLRPIVKSVSLEIDLDQESIDCSLKLA